MTFFDNQVRAKNNTIILVATYVVCVALIVLAVYFALLVVFQVGVTSSESRTASFTLHWWNPELFGWTAFCVLALILGGSAFKSSQLSQGGKVVAEMLGGTPVLSNTNDPFEKRLLNVVEEMAIASGLPVPRVYLLSGEGSINAFAAGFSTKDAVIGITSGAIRTLNRAELQGVVAHEFSHILNGDMRLNLRLVGILFGILLLFVIGRGILRFTPRSRSRNRDKGGAAIVLFGLALMIIGYIGAFFAKIIQSAVCRQREFLADASAIQFTRNPDGIGGALMKIGGWSASSQIDAAQAQEVSHFFFADGMIKSFFNLFATHPPLKERLGRIFPGLKPKFEALPDGYMALPDDDTVAVSHLASNKSVSLTAESVIEKVGNPSEEHVAYARSILDSLSPKVHDLLRDPYGARAIVVCLLLDRQDSVRERQLRRLTESGDDLLVNDVHQVLPELRFIGPEYRLPLASSALPALKSLPPDLYVRFRKLAQILIEEDRTCSVFEYAVQRMLRRHLDSTFFATPVKRRDALLVSNEIDLAAAQLIYTLAHLGSSDSSAARTAFDAGCRLFTKKVAQDKLETASIKSLDRSLSVLENAPPRFRETVLKASVACIASDREVSVEEAELIRAVADGLECPLPPLLSVVS